MEREGEREGSEGQRETGEQHGLLRRGGDDHFPGRS